MEIRVDSSLTFDEAIAGTTAPQEIVDTLALVDVEHLSFDGYVHRGQLLVHQDLAEETVQIFSELLLLSFPILKVIPIVSFSWDDNASMAANNSSAFNYRKVFGTDTLSNHSYGRAIDINPFFNPYEQSDGRIVPEGSVHDLSRPGTFVPEGDAVRVFTSHGWDWGGFWTRKDWQHFAKPARN